MSAALVDFGCVLVTRAAVSGKTRKHTGSYAVIDTGVIVVCMLSMERRLIEQLAASICVSHRARRVGAVSVYVCSLLGCALLALLVCGMCINQSINQYPKTHRVGCLVGRNGLHRQVA